MMDAFVYIIRCEGSDFYKIGSSNNPSRRRDILQIGCPYLLTVVYTVKSIPLAPHKMSLEKALHNRYQHKRQWGEWFLLSKEDIQHIKELTTA
jgi:predicted GIY-YIG superfamily endonuclease